MNQVWICESTHDFRTDPYAVCATEVLALQWLFTQRALDTAVARDTNRPLPSSVYKMGEGYSYDIEEHTRQIRPSRVQHGHVSATLPSDVFEGAGYRTPTFSVPNLAGLVQHAMSIPVRDGDPLPDMLSPMLSRTGLIQLILQERDRQLTLWNETNDDANTPGDWKRHRREYEERAQDILYSVTPRNPQDVLLNGMMQVVKIAALALAQMEAMQRKHAALVSVDVNAALSSDTERSA